MSDLQKCIALTFDLCIMNRICAFCIFRYYDYIRHPTVSAKVLCFRLSHCPIRPSVCSFVCSFVRWDIFTTISLHKRLETVFDKTDREYSLAPWPTTLTFNLRQAMVMILTYKLKFKGQSTAILYLSSCTMVALTFDLLTSKLGSAFICHRKHFYQLWSYLFTSFWSFVHLAVKYIYGRTHAYRVSSAILQRVLFTCWMVRVSEVVKVSQVKRHHVAYLAIKVISVIQVWMELT